jgi:hypothetical protein
MPRESDRSSTSPREPDRRSEERLDELRAEARREGVVDGDGVDVVGGPVPAGAPEGYRPPNDEDAEGYYGLPIVKPPVWTWEVPAYFFVGGLAGMAAVIALAGLLFGAGEALPRAALWTAAVGSVVSAPLLILDLGRPLRFLNMLRVFKWRSPMSVGAWTLSLFGGLSTAAALLVEWSVRSAATGGPPDAAILLTAGGAAGVGSVLATYTGVLVGATAIPAWFTHRQALPVHFGVAGLGSAAAFLELLGLRLPGLNLLGLGAAGVETVMGIVLELNRHGAADRALREGRSGRLLRVSGILVGPVALVLRLAGWVPGAAVAFLVGALVSRYGWLEAGRASGVDPEATLAAQRGGGAAPE